MKAIFLEDHLLPRGFCADCCSRMVKGEMPTLALELRKDLTLVYAYCSHNEAGAMLLAEPGRPQRWQITCPIDALAWDSYVALKAQRTRGALEQIRGPDLPAEKMN